VPELYHVDGVAKIRCWGREAALDALRQPAGTLIGRIAPDEVVVVGAPGTAAALLDDLESQLEGEGNAALVIDHTDGWTFFTVEGDGIEELWARVSAIRLPDANADRVPVFTVGKVCDVAAKVFVRPGRIDLMCGAEVRRHVTDRLTHAGHVLGLHEGEPSGDDPIGVGAAGTGVPA
jgi:hypothetical protein